MTHLQAWAILCIFATDPHGGRRPFLDRVREALARTTDRDLKRAIGAYAREHGA